FNDAPLWLWQTLRQVGLDNSVGRRPGDSDALGLRVFKRRGGCGTATVGRFDSGASPAPGRRPVVDEGVLVGPRGPTRGAPMRTRTRFVGPLAPPVSSGRGSRRCLVVAAGAPARRARL